MQQFALKTFILSFVFTPSMFSSVQAQDTRKPRTREVIYGHKDGLAMTFDYFEPSVKPNGSAVVFIVSGGWFSKYAPPEQTKFLLNPFLNAGYKCFAIRHGSSPKYSIKEAIEDLRLAIRTIRHDAKDYGIDPEHIGVFGMSAGGHLTLMLATTGDDGDSQSQSSVSQTSSRIAAGVALVPPSDLTGYIWSTPNLDIQYRQFPGLNISKKEAEAVSPLYFVTQDDAPCLIISGGKDTLVPPEQGHWIHEKMDEVGVKNNYIVYEKSGHGLERDMASAVTETLNWFNGHVK